MRLEKITQRSSLQNEACTRPIKKVYRKFFLALVVLVYTMLFFLLYNENDMVIGSLINIAKKF